MKKITLNVTDYTTEPYGRYKADGPGNGEEFRADYIMPKFNSLKKNELLLINLDGIEDEYGSSFVVEAFANLIRKENISYDKIKSKIQFQSTHNEWVSEINDYIQEAYEESLLSHDSLS
ncbi:STAS-like domain-containing protein [Photobacterium phosphoreum]|uniref:STAS-like domain-containing protein n=1 Tax=Photobacterium phosphoreum TaxID=659 RepID=UPI000D168B83|nr:DUF4325 domain-containing protein [Photobacterium phosphoreum]PSU54577.1 DUF4325 domain-containing protein [Photobacterium phosphoreum]